MIIVEMWQILITTSHDLTRGKYLKCGKGDLCRLYWIILKGHLHVTRSYTCRGRISMTQNCHHHSYSESDM